jgi:hypothetical protein
MTTGGSGADSGPDESRAPGATVTDGSEVAPTVGDDVPVAVVPVGLDRTLTIRSVHASGSRH